MLTRFLAPLGGAMPILTLARTARAALPRRVLRVDLVRRGRIDRKLAGRKLWSLIGTLILGAMKDSMRTFASNQLDGRARSIARVDGRSPAAGRVSA